MAINEKSETNFDLRVAYLLTHYGPEALLVVREHIQRYRIAKEWDKEKEWLDIYSQILLLSDHGLQNSYMN
ncbi:MAG: hypothetical protein DHS20C07_26240 [Methyloligella sp.]|nr:MAG: hypothetical protein DHS20C07_26240 [Methyloligella sp.]